MKTLTITSRLSKTARKMIENTISTHERYHKSYFFSSASSAGQRRSNEKKFDEQNPDYILIKGRDIIKVNPSYSESCKNVYYHLTIIINGISSKNIKYLKGLLK